MRSILSSTILTVVGLIFVACTPLAPAPTGGAKPTAALATTVPVGTSRTGGILHVGQAATDVGTVDPHYASGTPDRALVDMVFNGLLRFKPGDSTGFDPDLATTLPGPITNAAGKQAWTFMLRKGVTCHPSDGVPAYELTGDDVVYSLQKAANKDTSAYASDYVGMTFASSDPYTVTVALDQPLSAASFIRGWPTMPVATFCASRQRRNSDHTA